LSGLKGKRTTREPSTRQPNHAALHAPRFSHFPRSETSTHEPQHHARILSYPNSRLQNSHFKTSGIHRDSTTPIFPQVTYRNGFWQSIFSYLHCAKYGLWSFAPSCRSTWSSRSLLVIIAMEARHDLSAFVSRQDQLCDFQIGISKPATLVQYGPASLR
jgi:hypothetical protein